MKQDNFLFVDLVSSIFLLILMVGNTMGLLFITDGNFFISVLISLFIVVCYYFIIQVLKRNKEDMVNKNYMVPSSIFFLVFLIFGFASFVFMSHFLNIELNFKQKIQSEVTSKLDDVNGLSQKYKTISTSSMQNFEAELDKKLRNYVKNPNTTTRNSFTIPYDIPGNILNSPQYINVNSVVSAKVNPYRLKIQSNQHNIDSLLIKGTQSYKKTFDNWNWLNLMQDYKGLGSFTTKSYDYVNSKISELPVDNTILPVPEQKELLPLNNPIELNKIYKPDYFAPAVTIFVIHLFILIPFFLHKVRKGGGSKNKIQKGEIEGGISL